MLKSGGVMVYSTCSFSKKQNEDIVGWFLQQHPDAQLECIPNRSKFPSAPPVHPSESYKAVEDVIMERTLRFSPSASKTSGLFIARFRKRGSIDSVS